MSHSDTVQTSPARKLGVGSSQNQAFRMERSVETSRDALKGELSRKITSDDPSVLRRLRLDEVPDSFVEACASRFYDSNVAAIEKLMDLEREGTKKSAGEKPSKKETAMYAPLVSACDY